MRIRDRGSVVGFSVVAVAILALLIGAVALVRYFDNKPAAPANQPSDGKVSTDDKANDKTGQPNDDQALKKALTDQSNKSSSGGDGGSQPSSTSSNLPQTGPTDDIVMVVAAGLLVGSGIAYIGSRRLI